MVFTRYGDWDTVLNLVRSQASWIRKWNSLWQSGLIRSGRVSRAGPTNGVKWELHPLHCSEPALNGWLCLDHSHFLWEAAEENVVLYGRRRRGMGAMVRNAWFAFQFNPLNHFTRIVNAEMRQPKSERGTYALACHTNLEPDVIVSLIHQTVRRSTQR